MGVFRGDDVIGREGGGETKKSILKPYLPTGTLLLLGQIVHLGSSVTAAENAQPTSISSA